jgi:hypothetical protein
MIKLNGSKVFTVNILSLQPSQLFINKDKLKAIEEIAKIPNVSNFSPLPVKMLNDKMILTDGHTRATFLYLHGIISITVQWDDPWDSPLLNKKVYQQCVDWCIKEGVLNIANLSKRIISKEAYEIQWIQKCASLQL